MGKRRYTVLGGGLALCLGLWAGSVWADCAADTVTVRGMFGEARFDVTVADDPAERAQGLMFVENLPRLSGMLFVFDTPQPASFWMRNTLIPLDMIFVGADGVIDSVHSNAVPLDETPIFGGDAIKYVLEINGGLADQLGLSVGDQLQHPSITGDVVWPCLQE